MTQPRPSILCVDDDRDVVEVVQAILEDEGYAVSCLYDLTDDALLRTIGRLEPDAVLLDGFAAASYGDAWDLAAGIRNRPRSVPVVMFTAQARDIAEPRRQHRIGQRGPALRRPCPSPSVLTSWWRPSREPWDDPSRSIAAGVPRSYAPGSWCRRSRPVARPT